MKTIDATGLILGRLATRIAKMALLGESVNIVNCEKAVISGNKYNLYKEYQDLRDKGGPFHGPFVHRMPDKFVKRIIRSMLPYKNERGKKALKLVLSKNVLRGVLFIRNIWLIHFIIVINCIFFYIFLFFFLIPHIRYFHIIY